MSGIFPMFPSVVRRDGGGGLPLYRDVAMDFGAGRPLWSGGNPVVVCGLEAVKSWAWRDVPDNYLRHTRHLLCLGLHENR